MTLPAPGRYATGILYLDTAHHEESEKLFDELAASHGLKVSCMAAYEGHLVGVWWACLLCDGDDEGKVYNGVN